MRPQTGFACLFEHATGVDFDTRLGIDDDGSCVDAMQCTDSLADKVGISGRVDYVEPFALMLEVDNTCFDRVFCDFFPRRQNRIYSCPRQRWDWRLLCPF